MLKYTIYTALYHHFYELKIFYSTNVASVVILVQSLTKVVLSWIQPAGFFYRLFKYINILRFPMLTGNASFQLPGFSYAFNKGYSAVVYVNDDITNESFIVFSKTRVTPIETGAHLLEQCTFHGNDLFGNRTNVTSVKSLTNSTIVLSWTGTSTHLLKIFVAERVSQIVQSEPTLLSEDMSRPS